MLLGTGCSSETSFLQGAKKLEPLVIGFDTPTVGAYQASLASEVPKSAYKLMCMPSSQVICDLNKCESVIPKSYFIVDYSNRESTYSRCDVAGCNDEEVTMSDSGAYTNFTPQGGGFMFKVVLYDFMDFGDEKYKGNFVDVATLGTATITSFGTCEFRSNPITF